jgi:hypothetical protein
VQRHRGLDLFDRETVESTQSSRLLPRRPFLLRQLMLRPTVKYASGCTGDASDEEQIVSLALADPGWRVDRYNGSFETNCCTNIARRQGTILGQSAVSS